MAKKKIDTPRSFAHDSNARNSSKLINLRMAHGAAGYGVYFMLLERLRDALGYVEVLNYDVLAYDLRETPELIRSVIEDFGLFAITPDGTSFYSETLLSRLSAQYVTSAPAEPSTPAEPSAPTEPSAPAEPSAPSENSEFSEFSEFSESSELSDKPEIPVPSLRDFIDAASCDDDWLEEIGGDLFLDNEYLTEVIRSDFYAYCCESKVQFETLDAVKDMFYNWLLPKL